MQLQNVSSSHVANVHIQIHIQCPHIQKLRELSQSIGLDNYELIGLDKLSNVQFFSSTVVPNCDGVFPGANGVVHLSHFILEQSKGLVLIPEILRHGMCRGSSIVE